MTLSLSSCESPGNRLSAMKPIRKASRVVPSGMNAIAPSDRRRLISFFAAKMRWTACGYSATPRPSMRSVLTQVRRPRASGASSLSGAVARIPSDAAASPPSAVTSV